MPNGEHVVMPLDSDAARRNEATDLEGHRWHFGERFDHIRARGGSVPDSVSEHCD